MLYTSLFLAVLFSRCILTDWNVAARLIFRVSVSENGILSFSVYISDFQDIIIHMICIS